MSEARPQRIEGSWVKPHNGVNLLILGILGVVGLPPLGVLAWVLARISLREMREGITDPSGRGLTNAARILGLVSIVLTCIWAVGIILYLCWSRVSS